MCVAAHRRMSEHPVPRFGVPLPRLVLFGVLCAWVFVGCTAGDPQFTAESPAGFWLGLWHGMISLVTLVVGLFDDQVRVYEVHNTFGERHSYVPVSYTHLTLPTSDLV